MNPTDSLSELRSEMERVYRFYAAMARELDPETGLGGKLVWAGELDAEGSRLVRAANIAGAASLSAAADPAAQREAIHQGVIDFLVTSLNEALRILKNELRKRNAVAVGVTDGAERIAEEMRERGVLPDLLRAPAASDVAAGFVKQGARVIAPATLPEGCDFRVFANPPADFDARALSLVPEWDTAMRRWLRLSPRYLGPQARRVRSIECDDGMAEQLNRNV